MLLNLERLIQRLEAQPYPDDLFKTTKEAIMPSVYAVVLAIADDANSAAEQDWNLSGFRKALLALLERPEAIRGQRSQWKCPPALTSCGPAGRTGPPKATCKYKAARSSAWTPAPAAKGRWSGGKTR